jgi:hypothetical protein
MLKSPQLCDEAIKSQLRRVFTTFASLLSKRPRTFGNNNYTNVKTFSPLEMVVVAVLLSVFPNRPERFLHGDILYIRLELRKVNKDLKLNSTLWRDAWYLIENLERVRGATDGTTGIAADDDSSSGSSETSSDSSDDDASVRGPPRRSIASARKESTKAQSKAKTTDKTQSKTDKSKTDTSKTHTAKTDKSKTHTPKTDKFKSGRKPTSAVETNIGTPRQVSPSAAAGASIIGTDQDPIVRVGKAVTGQQGPDPRMSVVSDLVGSHQTRVPVPIRGNVALAGPTRNEPIAAATMRVVAGDNKGSDKGKNRAKVASAVTGQPKDSRVGNDNKVARGSPPAQARHQPPPATAKPARRSMPGNHTPAVMAPLAPMAPMVTAKVGIASSGAVAATPSGSRKRRERLDLSGIPSSSAADGKRVKPDVE